MKCSVLLEQVAENGYRATTGSPFGFTVEAATREEALRLVQAHLAARSHAGAELVQVDSDESDDPWLSMAGMFNPDDPMVQEWIQIMAENRRKADEDPEVW